jgi:hypothetical protein
LFYKEIPQQVPTKNLILTVHVAAQRERMETGRDIETGKKALSGLYVLLARSISRSENAETGFRPVK